MSKTIGRKPTKDAEAIEAVVEETNTEAVVKETNVKAPWLALDRKERKERVTTNIRELKPTRLQVLLVSEYAHLIDEVQLSAHRLREVAIDEYAAPRAGKIWAKMTLEQKEFFLADLAEREK